MVQLLSTTVGAVLTIGCSTASPSRDDIDFDAELAAYRGFGECSIVVVAPPDIAELVYAIPQTTSTAHLARFGQPEATRADVWMLPQLGETALGKAAKRASVSSDGQLRFRRLKPGPYFVVGYRQFGAVSFGNGRSAEIVAFGTAQVRDGEATTTLKPLPPRRHPNETGI